VEVREAGLAVGVMGDRRKSSISDPNAYAAGCVNPA